MKRYLFLILICLEVISYVSAQDINELLSTYEVDSTRKSLIIQEYESIVDAKVSKSKQQKIEKQLRKTFSQDLESMMEIILEKDNEFITIAHNLQEVMSKAEYSSIWTTFKPEDKDIFKSDSIELSVMQNLFNLNNQHDCTIPYVKVGADMVSIHLFEYIFFQKSTSGAWKACMLECLKHYFNKFYSQLTYVYTQEDLSKIKSRTLSPSIDTNLEQYDIRPRIYRNSGNRYYVQLCFWSDFVGLIRSTYRVDINAEDKAEVQHISHSTLYKYQANNIIF